MFGQSNDGKRVLFSNGKPLTSLMDNVLASRLGKIARQAGDVNRCDVGDSIDRGLILRRLMDEAGFEITEKR